MIINEKDLKLRQDLYERYLIGKKNNISISLEELGFYQHNLKTNRKIIKPRFVKVNLYTVFKFYINLGIVFKDKNKKLYSMEEAEHRIIKYYEENNIDYKI